MMKNTFNFMLDVCFALTSLTIFGNLKPFRNDKKSFLFQLDLSLHNVVKLPDIL